MGQRGHSEIANPTGSLPLVFLDQIAIPTFMKALEANRSASRGRKRRGENLGVCDEPEGDRVGDGSR